MPNFATSSALPDAYKTHSSSPSLAEQIDLSDEELNELEALLLSWHEYDARVPDWEFCDGFLTALVCAGSASALSSDEEGAHSLKRCLEVMLHARIGELAEPQELERFGQLALKRMEQLRVQMREQPLFHPHVVDMRGAILALTPEDESAVHVPEQVPALGQVWASGFSWACQHWHWEQVPDFDPALLQKIFSLMEDDAHPLALNLYDESAPPSISQERLEGFFQALLAAREFFNVTSTT